MVRIDRIIRSRRRTLALEIDREAALIVRAPRRLPLSVIEEFVGKKEHWIVKKQGMLRRRQEAKIIPMTVGREEARRKIIERVEWHSQALSLKYNRVDVSSAKTRWGSCNVKGSIRLNWRLAMAPAEVLDYVIIHELMHLQVRSHSRSFWGKVGAVLPNYKTHRQWLKENGHLLSS